MEKNIEFYFEKQKKTSKKYRGKNIFKAKIIYLIEKYYRNQPIYVYYFKRYGSYHKIRNVLEELVEEGYLIKYKKVRPVYYLKSETSSFVTTASSINYI